MRLPNPHTERMMKRLGFSLAILSIFMLACNLSTVTTPTATAPAVVTVAPVPSNTPLATQLPVATEPPTAALPPVPQTNVSCFGLALYLDPALASGAKCESISASTEGMEMYPQYTRLTLQDYLLSDRFFTAHISIYPVQAYADLLPDNIPTDVASLQALIGGGSIASKSLPLLPYFNAGQEFFTQYQVIAFTNGSGIHYLTQYSQYFDPINNHELFYTFQGLTSDGMYWISAILPVSNPILPADGNNPPNGQTQEEFGNNFTTYIADLAASLNAQQPGSFSPDLSRLDALVASLQFQP
jgi:hypothetical protein